MKTIMKTTILRNTAMLLIALFSLSASAQHLATAPQAQLPSSSMKSVQTAGCPTHGTITVNPNAYRVGAASAAVRTAAPVYNAPKAAPVRGGLLSGGSIQSGLVNTIGATTPVQLNNIAGVSNGKVAGTTPLGGGYRPDPEPDEDGDKNDPVYGSGVVPEPIGGPFVPFILMLLVYALFLLVRGDAREEQEQA